MEEQEVTPQKGRGFPRWAWILVAVVVVVGLIAGVSMLYTSTRKDTPVTPTTAPPVAASGADGCIAGRANDADSLLEGARKQPHTAEGAAATAAGFLRFAAQYPWPTEQELTAVLTDIYVLAPGEDAQDLAKDALSTSPLKNAQTAGFSLANGRYVIEPSSSHDEVQVSVAAHVVNDGTLSGVTSATTYTLVWSDGIWKVADFKDIDDEQTILDAGAAFIGGC